MTDFIGSAAAARSKGLAIYKDMIYFLAPDGAIVAIDAKTGKVRWANIVQDYKELSQNTSAPMVVDGKVITSRTCETRAGCFISAHDAETGKEVWKFYNTPAPGEPGGDSWGGLPAERGSPASWGLPGSYDPAARCCTGRSPIRNPGRGISATATSMPFRALLRPSSTAIRRSRSISRPASSSGTTSTCRATIGTSTMSTSARWCAPGQSRSGGGEMDQPERQARRAARRGARRRRGRRHLDAGPRDRQFLWATPFPYDTPDFHISKIDVDTGRTYINWDKVKKHDGDRILVCFHNTRSFWSTAYDPRKNAIYIPYTNSCLDMTENYKSPSGFGPRRQVMASGRRSEEICLDREGRPLHRQDRQHLLAADTGQRLSACHRRRCAVLG